eukprot:SAG31_NODE_10_length_40133_cov_27.863041_4_plen_90_part_00
MSDGRILFAKPASLEGRCNGTLRISYDGARSWGKAIPIGATSKAGYGYSCVIHVPGERPKTNIVGIIFETNAKGCDGVSCQLRYRNISL